MTGGSIATTIDLGEFFAMDACETLYWIAWEMAKESGEKVLISEWRRRELCAACGVEVQRGPHRGCREKLEDKCEFDTSNQNQTNGTR